MIPKIIHYCWFGGKPIPKEYQRYIESWRKFMPDYEIWQWKEEPLNGNGNVNVNVNVNDNVRSATLGDASLAKNENQNQNETLR